MMMPSLKTMNPPTTLLLIALTRSALMEAVWSIVLSFQSFLNVRWHQSLGAFLVFCCCFLRLHSIHFIHCLWSFNIGFQQMTDIRCWELFFYGVLWSCPALCLSVRTIRPIMTLFIYACAVQMTTDSLQVYWHTVLNVNVNTCRPGRTLKINKSGAVFFLQFYRRVNRGEGVSLGK